MSIRTVAATATTPAGARTVAGRQPGVSLRHLLIAVGGWAVLRLLGLAVLYFGRDRADRSLGTLLTSYDAQWYLSIAQQGYDHGPQPDGAGGLTASNLAFHPLLPTLIRALLALGVPATAAALAVTALAGLAAAAAIYRLGEVLHGARVGVLLVLLWGALPHAVVQSMAYTESLFTALVAVTLLALVRGRWVAAALCCVVAGLTRPTATALVATVGVVALVAICRRRDGWRPWAAVLIAPAGLLGYWAWVAARVGRLDGWFWLQYEGWHTYFDGGRATVGQLVVGFLDPKLPGYLATSVVVTVFGVLTVLLVAHRQAPLPVLVFSVAIFVVVVGSAGSYHSKGRLLVPAFSTLLPLASAFVGARTLSVLSSFAAVAATSLLYGGYLLTVWPLSP